MSRWRRLLGPACASLLVHAAALIALALVTVRLTLGGAEPREPVTVTLAPQTMTPAVRAPQASDTRTESTRGEPVARTAPVVAVPSNAAIEWATRDPVSGDDFARSLQQSGRGEAASPGIALGGQRVEFAGASAQGASTIVFVIDRSGPMVTVRTPVHTEARRAAQSLGEGARFEVIATGGDAPLACFGELRTADRTAMRTLDEWLDGLLSGGSPDPGPGLARALGLKPDVIFLLSSGTEPSVAAAERGARAIQQLDALNQPGPDGVRRTLILPIRFGDAGDGSLLDTIARRFGPPGASGALVRALDELPTEPSVSLAESEALLEQARSLASRASAEGIGLFASLGMTSPEERERIVATARTLREALGPVSDHGSLDPDTPLLRARALLTLAACLPVSDERRGDLLARASDMLKSARDRTAGRPLARVSCAQLDVLRTALAGGSTTAAIAALRELEGENASISTALVLIASADSAERVSEMLTIIPKAQRPLAISIGVRRALLIGSPNAAWTVLRDATSESSFDAVRAVLSARLARRTTSGATAENLLHAARASEEPGESLRWLDDAARIAPDDVTRVEALARAADLLGDTSTALERLVDASAIGSREATRRAVRLGMSLDARAEPVDTLYDAALRAHAALMPEAEDHAYWLGVLGERLLAGGQASESLAPLGEAARRGDEPATSALIEASQVVRTDEAIRALRDASLVEEAGRLALKLAEELISERDPSAALEMLDLIDTSSDDAALARVEAMRAMGQTEDAMRALRPVLDRVETRGIADARFWRAWTLTLELFADADDGSLTADRALHLRRLRTVDPALGGPPWRERLDKAAP